MGKKQGGVNTKVEAANARKATARAAKDAKASAAAEAAEAQDWARGSNARGDQRRASQEAKKAEQEAKKAELQKLQALEEHALVEDKGAIRKAKKDKSKDVARPWEEALKPAVKKNNKGSRASPAAAAPSSGKLTQAEMAALREQEAAKNAKRPGKSEIQFDAGFTENRNRSADAQTEARSVDAALDLLSIGDKDLDRHPERRAKAAYKAFEELMLPQLKEDYPGLKLSQYKQRLSEAWRKSPENPLNQERLAYNAKK